MRRRFLPVLATGLMAILLAMPAPAAAWTTQGGATLEPGRGAVEAAIGWPGVRLGGRIGVKPGFEIGPYLSFGFWNDLLDTKPTLNNALGCLVKVNLANRGGFRLAVQGDPQLKLEYWPDGVKLGWQIGFPELVMSWQLTPGLDIDFGLKVPLSLVFDHDYRVEVRLPILAGLGFEFELTKNLNLFGLVEAGPNLTFSAEEPTCSRPNSLGIQVCNTRNTTGGNHLGVLLNVMVGVTYRLP